MKKVQLFFLAFVMAMFSLTSCNEYRSFTNVTKLSQLSGNPFYYNLSKSLLKNVGSFLVQEGLKSQVGKVNLLSPLSSFLTNASQVGKFKNMLGTSYRISPTKMDEQFSSLVNMKDLIYFVAKNGTKF